MKHILFLTWKDTKHPRAWWAENVIYEYAARLVKEWHNVTWFASSYKWAKSSEQIDWIQLIRKYSLNTIYFFAWKWYRKWRKSNTPDIIIDEAWGIPLFSPLYERKIPIFFFIHHIWNSEWDKAFPYPFNKFFKWAMSKTIALYKNKPTITVSESTKIELKNTFWFTDLTVINNACNIEPIKSIDFKKKKKEIIFLGRLMPIKRVEDSIQAFYHSNLIQDWYKLIIIWEWDVNYLTLLKQIIDDLDIKTNVDFLWYSDRIKRQKLMDWRALLVTSIKEWYGLVVIEANSFGLPVLGYKVPGLIDSIRENVNGYLISNDNPEELGNKLRESILDNEWYKTISESSLDYVKTLWSWDDRYKEFKKIILK